MSENISEDASLVIKLIRIQCLHGTLLTVPALASAGPDCDPCGGPLKVIVQSKKGLMFWYINIS
jgi:hypothetical protein